MSKFFVIEIIFINEIKEMYQSKILTELILAYGEYCVKLKFVRFQNYIFYSRQSLEEQMLSRNMSNCILVC